MPRPWSWISTPSARSASSRPDMGRVRACGSPSKLTVPVARAATGGTKRITVPARPQSTAPAWRSPGLTSQLGPEVSTSAPKAVSALAISSVSRERSARRTTDGPSERAASTSARLVSDFDPGSSTRTSTGPRATGAGHRSRRGAGRVSTPQRLLAEGLRGESSLELGLPGQTAGLAAGALHGVLGAPRDAGTAFGVDRGQDQPAQHREILEEVHLVVGLGA